MPSVAIKSSKNKKRFESRKAYVKTRVFAINDIDGVMPYTITHIKTCLRIGQFPNLTSAINALYELEMGGKINWQKKNGEYSRQDGKYVSRIVRNNDGIMA